KWNWPPLLVTGAPGLGRPADAKTASAGAAGTPRPQSWPRGPRRSAARCARERLSTRFGGTARAGASEAPPRRSRPCDRRHTVGSRAKAVGYLLRGLVRLAKDQQISYQR